MSGTVAHARAEQLRCAALYPDPGAWLGCHDWFAEEVLMEMEEKQLPRPYYEHAGITIYHGDCREVLPGLPKVDLVLTDPPYGIEFTGKKTKHTSGNSGGYGAFDDTPAYIESVVVPIITDCLARFERVIVTPGIRNCWKYPEPASMGTLFYPAGAGLGRWGFICSQPILYYGNCPYLAAGMGHRPDSFSTVANCGAAEHPCEKPLSTMKWLLAKGSLAVEDIILDPFMCSGTTLVAAKNLGRRAIGIEIEEKYCEIAAKRLAQEVLW
jgi:hypothetical protein